MFNPTRIEYILDEAKHFFIDKNENLMLKNLEILDIGCGGGLTSEPMARLGGRVTGIDAAEKKVLLYIAKKNLIINYQNKSPEQLQDNEKYVIF